MLLQTKIEIDKGQFEIRPADRMLFVGSCFAAEVGRRFVDDGFEGIVNPYGTMYNPASVLHTVSRVIKDGVVGIADEKDKCVDVAVMTLGTNHVYILNETGEIVDNCQKRPQRLFTERELNVKECSDYLREAIGLLRKVNPDVRVVLTVSPIRYQKYGFHVSQLSKATLLMAVDEVVKDYAGNEKGVVDYFPSYEIMMDELRDYRFYAPDMLHPTEQAVDYIYERFRETYFSSDAETMRREWEPIRKALSHRPFNPDSEQHKQFMEKVNCNKQEFIKRWKS